MNAGNAAARNRTRQLARPATVTPWTRKTHQNPIARRNPIGQKKSRRTMNRPRDWGGRNSLRRAGSTTSIPPSPSPARSRNPKTLQGSHARAVRAVNTEYQRMLTRNTVRRPRASARRPRTRLPMNEPINVAEATRKYSTGCAFWLIPNVAKIPVGPGSTKPMRMISNATNVHANPVIATIRRWKAVNPPSRRTSSTVRVADAIDSGPYWGGILNLGRGLEGDRGRVRGMATRIVLHVRPVERHAVRDDLAERVPQPVVIERPRREEVVVAVQAPLQLPLVGHADPVAVHAELRVVDGVHDLDLRPVEEVDPPVVHLPDEDAVRLLLKPLLHAIDVDVPVPHPDEFGHELDQLELQALRVADEVDHRGDVREGVLEQDHVQLHGLQADLEGPLDPAEDGGELPLPDVPERDRVEGVDGDVHALQPRRPEPLRAGAEHGAVRCHRHVRDVADGPADDLLHVEPDEGLPARVLHAPDPEFARDPDDPLDLLDGHLVPVGGAWLHDRPEALIVAVD